MITHTEYERFVKVCDDIIEITKKGNRFDKDSGDIESSKFKNLDEFKTALKLIDSDEVEDEELPLNENIDLSLLNVNPSANDIVKQIKAIKRKPKSQQPKVITCLFHGAPGTGKTTLAKEICAKLGVKPLVKSYADIQSKYVGDGEKNLQAVFAEAREKNKVLILDEADSLMLNRESTDKEWQKTMTNQFLTELDSHIGIFIATTNFVSNLDPACLRRLFLKLEFSWLDEKQKVKAFYKFFGKKVKEVPVKFLTPGDFKAVRERSLYEPKAPDSKRLIELLKDEVAYKEKTMKVVMDANKRGIGFR